MAPGSGETCFGVVAEPTQGNRVRQRSRPQEEIAQVSGGEGNQLLLTQQDQSQVQARQGLPIRVV